MQAQSDAGRSPREAESSSTLELGAASRLDIEALTAVYNESRRDFMIPMPMSAGRMRDYIRAYDIDLGRSLVAFDADTGRGLGLALLGMRPERSWISRLGVLPEARRGGTGRRMVEGLIRAAREAGRRQMVIEVVRDNQPARQLFASFGFEPTRELLVTRRAPEPVDRIDHGATIEVLGQAQALELLQTRSDHPSWATETRSMRRAGNIAALLARWPDGSRGWLAYASSAWKLSRIVIETQVGDPDRVGGALLQQLHWRYPLQDSVCENLSAHDAHWPAMQAAGYFVAFSRVEMILEL